MEENEDEEGQVEETVFDMADFDIRGLGEEELVSRIRFIVAKYRNRPDLNFVYGKLDLLSKKADEIDELLFARRLKTKRAERDLAEGFAKIDDVAQALASALKDEVYQGILLSRYEEKLGQKP